MTEKANRRIRVIHLVNRKAVDLSPSSIPSGITMFDSDRQRNGASKSLALSVPQLFE